MLRKKSRDSFDPRRASGCALHICCLQKFHRPTDNHPRSPTGPARSVGADVCHLLRNPFCVTRQALLSQNKAGSPNFKEKTSQSLFISWFFLKPQKTEELRNRYFNPIEQFLILLGLRKIKIKWFTQKTPTPVYISHKAFDESFLQIQDPPHR